MLLTKPDLCNDVPQLVAEVATVAGDAPVHVVGPLSGYGMEHVAFFAGAQRTCALLGSSGVGKSTIVNCLVGRDLRRTRSVRSSDSKGRHTTTHRELIPIPSGGLLIDTPGMREVQLWDVGSAVEQTFEDVEALAAACHFSNCRHRDEPRCAVKAAVEAGAARRIARGELSPSAGRAAAPGAPVRTSARAWRTSGCPRSPTRRCRRRCG